METIVTNHAIERFRERIDPTIGPKAACNLLRHHAKTGARQKERTSQGHLVVLVPDPPARLILKADHKLRAQVVVTVLWPEEPLDFEPHVDPLGGPLPKPSWLAEEQTRKETAEQIEAQRRLNVQIAERVRKEVEQRLGDAELLATRKLEQLTGPTGRIAEQDRTIGKLSAALRTALRALRELAPGDARAADAVRAVKAINPRFLALAPQQDEPRGEGVEAPRIELGSARHRADLRSRA